MVTTTPLAEEGSTSCFAERASTSSTFTPSSALSEDPASECALAC